MRWRRSLLWIAAGLVMAIVVALRLSLTFDLSAFLPRHAMLLHEVLVEQIRNGPASRLLVIGINGASEDSLARASEALKTALAAEPAFTSVANGEIDLADAEVPAPIDRYFLLMRDIDYSTNALRAAVQSRLRDLALAGGRTLVDLIARDPYLATLDVLERLSPVEAGSDLWFAADGSAVLIAETEAASIDIGAQRVAIDTVRRAFDGLAGTSGLGLEITGVGAFSVELQQTIRAEATLRSILASAALVVVLFLVLRSPRLVLLSVLPLGMGFLAGLAVVSAVFGEVHGITLAFGFTMLGVAVDYPLHLFSHARNASGDQAIARIWPTLRLGVLSTSIAYLALVFAGSTGLAQLGLFTAAGIVVAMFVTRTWLPLFVASQVTETAPSDAPPLRPVLSLSLGVIVLLTTAAVSWRLAQQGLWDDNLTSLSPVPAERLAVDRDLRAAATTPDMRYQLVLMDDSVEALLDDCEQADALLADAESRGLLESWQAVCQLLPSRQRQQMRQAAIPDAAILRGRLHDAIAGTPFREAAFEPFLQSAAAARRLEILDPATIAATPLGPWLDSHLLEVDSEWVALISLVRPEPSELAARVEQWPLPASVVDIQAALAELMQDYRRHALAVIAVAVVLILALLWYERGEIRQTIWIGMTVAAALSTTCAVTVLVHGGLTVMHLIALLLVLGLGLDYALFLSRVESVEQRRRTRAGVFQCALSTTLVFGILAGSSIHVLQYLGLTVATGSAASYVLAFFGSRR